MTKHLRIEGLVLAMLVFVMGVGGVSTASGATELYKGGSTLPAGTTIHASLAGGGSSLLQTTDETNTVNTCTGSEVQAKSTASSAETIPAEITSVTWSGCTSTTDTLTNGSLSIAQAPSTDNGTLTGSGTVWTVMLGGTSCRYGTGAGTNLGTITGETSTAKHATADVKAVINEQEPKQFLCPDTTIWKATYTITTPTGLNVGDPSERAATELYRGGETLKQGTTLTTSVQSGTSITQSSTDGTSIVDTCTGTTLEATSEAAASEPLTLNVKALTWAGCSFTTDTLATGTLAIASTTGHNGTLSGSGTSWTTNIGVSCRYGFGESTNLGTITGKTGTGEHATVDVNAIINEQEPKQFLCPDTTIWKATYTITTPTGLNVRSG